MTSRHRTSRVLVFEPFRGGHHPEYLRALADAWRAESIPGTLTFACPSKTIDQASIDAAPAGSQSRVEHLELPDLEPWPFVGRFAADTRHARLLERAARQVEAHDVVAMYLDRLLLPLATGLRLPQELRLHAIYFRPSVHYTELRSSPLSIDERVRARARHTLLLAALRNPSIDTVFSLDPTFAERARVRGKTSIVPCPDVIQASATTMEIEARRRRWGIEPERRTALFFGFLAHRKGFGSLCDALRLLEREDQRRLAVVFCGQPVPDESREIRAALDDVTRQTSVRVVVDQEDLHFAQVQSAFEAADLALVPYLRHIGSSAVLLRAAAARRPVIASDFGLVGHYVATHSLGRAVDTRVPWLLARALSDWLRGDDLGFDTVRAVALATRHGAREMASTVFERLRRNDPRSAMERAA